MENYLEVLSKLEQAQHQFTLSGLLAHLGELVHGNISYLKEGVKYNLWSNPTIKEETEMVDADIYNLTKMNLNNMDNETFMICLSKISEFIIDYYREYVNNESPAESIKSMLNKHRKGNILKIWLRYYLRLSSLDLDVPSELMGDSDITSYIG